MGCDLLQVQKYLTYIVFEMKAGTLYLEMCKGTPKLLDDIVSTKGSEIAVAMNLVQLLGANLTRGCVV